MPTLSVSVVLIVLVMLVETAPHLRIPTGLVLAIATTGSGAHLLPVTILGAIGVMLARLGVALQSRNAAAHSGTPGLHTRLGASLTGLTQYRRATFLLAAAPGPGSSHLFRLIGAMGGSLGPALAGTLVGRIPVLLITTSMCAWIARAVTPNDATAALLLGVVVCIAIPVQLLAGIDWTHRTATGRWRMRPQGNDPSRWRTDLRRDIADPDVIDAEVIEVIDEADHPDEGDTT